MLNKKIALIVFLLCLGLFTLAWAYEIVPINEMTPVYSGTGIVFEPLGEVSVSGIQYNQVFKISDCYNSITYQLGKNYTTFETDIGVMDEGQNVGADFSFFNERGLIAKYHRDLGEKPLHVSLKVSDFIRLSLKSGPDGVWINPRFTKEDAKPAAAAPSNVPENPVPTYNRGSVYSDPDKMQTLAMKLADQVKRLPEFSKGKKIRVAVTRFETEQIASSAIANDVREDLSVGLVKTGTFTVVERARIDEVLKELKIGLSGLIDINTAKKLGKMVGADAVLLGRISDRGSFCAVDARLVEVETGESNIADTIELRK